MSWNDIGIPPGVVTGSNLVKLFKHAKDNMYALPAVNCTSSSTMNAVMQAGRDINSPVIIQFSNGGSNFLAGKGMKGPKAQIAGAIAGAAHVRAMAKHYGIPVVLHSDHCAHKLLPWFEGMVKADEEYFAKYGEPLFSSHMLDLSEEPLEENIKVCEKYLKRLAAVDCWLEMELGITGGEEDGVNNENVDNSKLYSQPEEIWEVYRRLSAISPNFTIAAAFGNVHGVYKPGSVQLRPELLGDAQVFVEKKVGQPKPIFFVFHGGSGSEKEKIHTAIRNGVVKMNVDTDTQWAYWDGLRAYEAKNRGYLQGQIGNPDGPDKPNKKKYDPRVWIRKAEESMIKRVQESFRDLNSAGVLGKKSKL